MLVAYLKFYHQHLKLVANALRAILKATSLKTLCRASSTWIRQSTSLSKSTNYDRRYTGIQCWM